MEAVSVELDIWGEPCKFGASRLLALRRSAASNVNLSAEDSGKIIMAIDRARWQHEESTGCHCWTKAIAEKPSAFSHQN